MSGEVVRLAQIITETIAKGSKPLTEAQRTCLVGAFAGVWPSLDARLVAELEEPVSLALRMRRRGDDTAYWEQKLALWKQLCDAVLP
jgi:hypothetical protein